jgi:DNA-binding LacI/PurR family transcriptional regulator
VQGLYAGLAEEGLQPGRDLSVIGFRDNPQLRYLSPPPACFELDLGPLGVAVARIITGIAAHRDGGKAPRPQVVWPMRFRETASIRRLAGPG